MKEWWAENFKDSATLILTGVKSVGQFLAGDANIIGNSLDHLPSTGGDVDQVGNSGTVRRVKNEVTKTDTSNLKHKALAACSGFNSGNCTGKAGAPCPRNANFMHKCSKRNSFKNARPDCPQVPQTKKEKTSTVHQNAPWAKRSKGKGKGTGGGKGDGY